MREVKIRDLALVAVAGGLLAFEALGLGAALPAAWQALADQGFLAEANAASRSAAIAATSVLREVGVAVSHAAMGAAKGAARLPGTPTLPRPAGGCVPAAGRQHARSLRPRVCVITVTNDAGHVVRATCASCRRAREVRRAVQTALRQAML